MSTESHIDVDAVVVSYNSADRLRGTVESLCSVAGVHPIVVDNASTDDSLATIADLPATTLAEEVNHGFATACNLGWQLGANPLVLFLNPDARIDENALRRLVAVLDDDPRVGIAAPRLVGDDGALQYSLRRFPRVRSTFAQALYLHRLAPTAPWADEIVRSRAAYDRPGDQEWVSGACMLVRRSVLEELDGWDAGFFLYCEDIDICRRTHDHGYTVRYEPAAVVSHQGGGSARRSATLPYLTASRIRYATLHRSRPAALAERAGIALESLTRFLTMREGVAGSLGHARSLRVALTQGRTPPLGPLRHDTERPVENEAADESVDVLLVCSSGGHLLQLTALADAWLDVSRIWVTFDKSDARSLLREERVVFAYGPTNRSFKNLLRNVVLAGKVVRRTRPRVIVTTGAGVAVPFAWVGRIAGARVIYVESLTRIEGPSLSCRLIAPIAHRIYAQWPELGASMPRAQYVGSVFADPA